MVVVACRLKISAKSAKALKIKLLRDEKVFHKFMIDCVIVSHGSTNIHLTVNTLDVNYSVFKKSIVGK